MRKRTSSITAALLPFALLVLVDDAGAQFTGNPFIFESVGDQRGACLGIAWRDSSFCQNIADLNDVLMCNAVANSSQGPCFSMTDRNLQLSCFGMAFAPNFPSNCRDISDVNLQRFCRGASSWDSGFCVDIPDTNTRLLCFAMATRNPFHCSDINNPYDRQFCLGVSAHDIEPCFGIE